MGLYIPYRGTLTEPSHDVANKRITTIVTTVTVETDLLDPTVSFDQLRNIKHTTKKTTKQKHANTTDDHASMMIT